MTCAATLRHNFGACLGATRDFFTTPGTRCASKFKSAPFLDKVFKAADPVFDLAIVIAESAGASEDTLKGIGKGRAFVRTGRDLLSLFNVFQDSFPAVVGHAKSLYALASKEASYSFTRQATSNYEEKGHLLKKNKTGGWDGNYNTIAVGGAERAAAVIENVGKGGGAATFIFGFGVCRPIANVQKYITKDIDPTASQIAKSFPSVMMANHISAFIGHIAAVVFQHLAYQRATSLQGRERYDQNQVESECDKKMLENGLGIAEKSFELATDIFHHTGYSAPSGLRLPINLMIGGLSLYKAWLKD